MKTTTGAHIMMRRRSGRAALVLALFAATGCDLDLQDPNFPTEEVVFSSGENLLALGVGIQAEMAAQMGPFIFSSSLVTDEMGAGANTFANFIAADRGDELDAAQYLSEQPWAGAYRVVKLANDLFRSVPDANLQAGTKSGLLAMAGLFKAMAFGQLATLFNQAPIDVGIDRPDAPFVSRTDLLAETLRLLEEARQQIQSTPVSAEFTSRVQAPGFNTAVTIDAMIARYSLMAENYAAALAAAERLPANARSEFRFSANDRNSLTEIIYRSGNAYQLRPRQDLRQDAEPGDQRPLYWVTPASIVGAARVLDDLAQYRADDSPFPVFLPDEMKLIRAEALARTGNLNAARALINEVRTQCPTSGTPTEPMACLPPLNAANLPDLTSVLNEILRQRRYELFLQGTRFEDMRRFQLARRKYDFLPLPQSECDRNPAAPC